MVIHGTKITTVRSGIICVKLEQHEKAFRLSIKYKCHLVLKVFEIKQPLSDTQYVMINMD